MVNSLHWPFSTVNGTAKNILLYGFCLTSYNIIDFDTFLQNRFGSCCLYVFLFIHSFRLSLPWNSPRSSRKNDCIHWLSSCTFRSLSSLPWLSLYWNNIFIENSFFVALLKPQHVKLTARANDGAFGTFPSQRPFEGFRQYSSPHTLAVCIDEWHFYATFLFHIFSKTTNCPLEIAAYNHGLLIQ